MTDAEPVEYGTSAGGVAKCEVAMELQAIGCAKAANRYL